MPVSTLGAAVTKTVFLDRRPGNPEPRVSDRGGVMANSVGIPSEGLATFLRTTLPAYRDLGIPVIVSVGGVRPGDYPELIARLAPAAIDGFELNISCPNLEAGGDEYGADPRLVEAITAACVRACEVPVITKLPPMVSSIAVLARAAEAGGASAVTVANSFPGYLVDPATRRPELGNGIGGVSGPALRPLALRLIKQASAGASVPVVACGGIASADDVLDAMALGACAAQIGTATFATPHAIAAIVCELMERCVALHARSIRDLIEEVR
jgi:dihydroorotate dehydrogenase (NAD+) catalytic subunit